MTGLELLEKYPLTAQIVRDWFMKSMLESFKDVNNSYGLKKSNPKTLVILCGSYVFLSFNHNPREAPLNTPNSTISPTKCFVLRYISIFLVIFINTRLSSENINELKLSYTF